MTIEKTSFEYGCNFLRLELDNYLYLLKKLVDINSYSYNPEGIKKVALETENIFRKLGFTATHTDSEDERLGCHTVLELGEKSKPAILLVSHHDTVYSAEEEKRNNFSWRVDNGKVYGPGTYDLKGGTITIYMMLTFIKEKLPDLYNSVRWLIIFDANEEYRAPDFNKFVDTATNDSDVKAALVFEGCNEVDGKLSLVLGRKARGSFEITVKGRSSHAGNNKSRGVSAILQMARFVEELESWNDTTNQLSLNIGTISGGTGENAVPESAKCIGEVRCFDSKLFSETLEKMKKLVENPTVISEDDGYKCKCEIKFNAIDKPLEENDENRFLFDVWKGAAQHCNLEIYAEHRGGISDANKLSGKFPTLDGLGPNGANDHCSVQSDDGKQEQEYAFIDSFVTQAVFNAIAIRSLINRIR